MALAPGTPPSPVRPLHFSLSRVTEEDSEVRCVVCDKKRPFSFLVAIFETAAADCFLLMPSGLVRVRQEATRMVAQISRTLAVTQSQSVPCAS